MIFLGDVAYPGTGNLIPPEAAKHFGNKPIFINLEGPIVKESENHINDQILFNSKGVIEEFKDFNLKVVNLANNHIMDLGKEGLQNTVGWLKKNELSYVGAGKDKYEAQKPVHIILNGQLFTFLSFGWEVIQCEIATSKKAGVNPLKKEHVLKSIQEVKKKYPDSHIVISFHWNYELELYPQPQERELAKLCIEEGAEAIIGSHSHLVQGFEMYQGSPIVYGLGNWFLPDNLFFNGKLKLPSETYQQLAFEWSPGREPVCHWFKYDSESHQIKYINSENLSKSVKIEELTPFRNLSHHDYVKWFKENRKKKIMLPIYKSTNHRVHNFFKDKWVLLRGDLIDKLLKLGLKRIRTNL